MTGGEKSSWFLESIVNHACADREEFSSSGAVRWPGGESEKKRGGGESGSVPGSEKFLQ